MTNFKHDSRNSQQIIAEGESFCKRDMVALNWLATRYNDVAAGKSTIIHER